MEKVLHQDKILEIKNFYAEDYCRDVIEYLDGTTTDSDNWNPICFPSVLGVNVGEQKPTGKVSVEDMAKIRDAMHRAVEEFFNRPVKNVTMSGHKYPTNSYAAPHSDSSELDGTPNAWQMNKYASILYLNRDYSGGEIYFPQHKINIAPGTGSLLVFEGSHEYLHGVKEITAGDRFTILAFWDNAESVYKKEFLDQKVEEQRIALDYVENAFDYGQYAGRTFGKQDPNNLYGILGNKE
jgi:hypothetical protein